VKTILHMIETGGTGGAETVYVDLVRSLDPSRWSHVPVLPTHEWMYDRLVESGFQPVLVPERHAFDVGYFAKMINLIRTRGVDLIHAHLFGSAVRAALLSRICNVPAIATLHGNLDVHPGQRFHALKIAAVNSGLKQIVYVSQQLQRTLLASVPLRRDLGMVITNGIDADLYSAAADDAFRREYGIGAGEFLVGTVATPGRPAKGLDILLDAVSILKELSPGCRFMVVGDLEYGRGLEVLRDRDSRGLADDVIFTGFRTDVHRALAAFDLYALTSRSEGFPLSLLQAMAAGLPIVSTRCGGPEQILDHGASGILVENGSATAIANAVALLRENPDERLRLGAAARCAVAARFTLEAQVHAYERVYESCLANSHGWGRRNRQRPARQAAV